jgi:hypothetical protein
LLGGVERAGAQEGTLGDEGEQERLGRDLGGAGGAQVGDAGGAGVAEEAEAVRLGDAADGLHGRGERRAAALLPAGVGVLAVEAGEHEDAALVEGGADEGVEGVEQGLSEAAALELGEPRAAIMGRYSGATLSRAC